MAIATVPNTKTRDPIACDHCNKPLAAGYQWPSICATSELEFPFAMLPFVLCSDCCQRRFDDPPTVDAKTAVMTRAARYGAEWESAVRGMLARRYDDMSPWAGHKAA